MTLVLTSAPAVEPVSVAEAKAHLRLDGTLDDSLVASLIVTSRLHVEVALGLALISQGWTYQLDRWPEGAAVTLPLRPVSAITSVRVLSASGTPTVMPSTDYVLDGPALKPRVVRTGLNWPLPGRVANGIEIAFTAGFGPLASDVPQPIRHALMMLVAHWYEHRDATELGPFNISIPGVISDLLKPYRAVRL